MAVLIEAEAVETEAVEEMIGVEEVVAAVVTMKGEVEAIEEEEVVAEDVVTMVLNIKSRRNISSRMIIEMELETLQAYKEVIARQKPSFTMIKLTRKSSP